MLRSDLPYSSGIAAQRVCAQNFQHSLGSRRRDKEYDLALVGNINRIEPQQLAGRLHFCAYGKAGLINLHAHA